MKMQEIFDKAVGSLLAQGQRSVSYDPDTAVSTKCMYRSSVGCCAIGHLIPDEIYKPGMDEGSSDVMSLICKYPEIKPLIWPEDAENQAMGSFFLRDLQDAHDTGAPQTWPNQFRSLAARYGLEYKFDSIPV